MYCTVPNLPVNFFRELMINRLVLVVSPTIEKHTNGEELYVNGEFIVNIILFSTYFLQVIMRNAPIIIKSY